MVSIAWATRAGSAQVKLVGPPVRDGAIGAGTCADVAENHERRRAMVPALADIRTVRFLADRMELELLHQSLETQIALRPGRTHLQPLRLGVARTQELDGRFH